MDENNSFLLTLLDLIFELKGLPPSSVPEAFDIEKHGVRFKMELVRQHPMTSDLACAAIEVIYGIVLESEVREFLALLVCQDIAMGRFRTWFIDSGTGNGASRLNRTSVEKRGRL